MDNFTTSEVLELINLCRMRWDLTDMSPLIALLPEDAMVAELGSFSGECSQQFLWSPKVKHLTCVDLWQGGYGAKSGMGGEQDRASKEDMGLVRRAFDVRMSPFPNSRYRVRQMDTVEAATHYSDAHFDLVYIDADHSYNAVAGDIRAWRPKVKPGGLLAGHDYGEDVHPDVTRAVKEELGGVMVFNDKSWAVRL